MIEICNLTKKFKRNTVLNNVSIKFEQKTYGLLGENGAGKTTLIRCITGFYSKYDGSVKTDGSSAGYLPQSFGAFKELTVDEMMTFFMNQKRLSLKNAAGHIAEILELVNLQDKHNVKVGKLSGGMVRRLGIAQALLGDPETIIFDEPTAGLDPEERLRFKNVIEKIKRGKTIILSTHIIEDVDALCDDIAVVKNGKIIKCADVQTIIDAASGKVYEVPADILNRSEGYETVKQFQKGNETYFRILSENFDKSYLSKPTVEDGYLCLTKGI